MKTCAVLAGLLAALLGAVFLVCVCASIVLSLVLTLLLRPGAGRKAFVQAARNIRLVEEAAASSCEYALQRWMRIVDKVGKYAWSAAAILLAVVVILSVAEAIWD